MISTMAVARYMRGMGCTRSGVVLALLAATLVARLAVVVPTAAADPLLVPAPSVPTAAQIDGYLAAKRSPMTGQGAAFVSSGVAQRVDPRLIVAIAGAESSFGQITCAPFNAWGYGCPNGPYRFTSWADGIATVTRGLRVGYLNSGLTSVAMIQTRYAPSGAANDPTGLNNHWVGNVSRFLIEMGGNPGNVDLSAAHAGTGGIAMLQPLGPTGRLPYSQFAFVPTSSETRARNAGTASVNEPLHMRIKVTNTGLRTWTAANIRLRRVDDEVHVASAPYAFLSSDVAPGDDATFLVDVVPSGVVAGTWSTQWRVEGPDGPFGPVLEQSVRTLVDSFVVAGARVISLPATLVAGTSAPVVIKFQNAGSASWQRSGDDAIVLGLRDTTGPALAASSWIGPRVPASLLEREVAPGEWGTFAFAVAASRSSKGTSTLLVLPFRGEQWATGQSLPISIVVTGS